MNSVIIVANMAHHFVARLRTTNTARLQEIYRKSGLVHFPDDGPIMRREPATNIRPVIKLQERAENVRQTRTATPHRDLQNP